MNRKEIVVIIVALVLIVIASWCASGAELDCGIKGNPTGDIHLYRVTNFTIRNCQLPDSEVRIVKSSNISVINNTLRHIRIIDSGDGILIEDNIIIGDHRYNVNFWQLMRSIDYWTCGNVTDFELLMIIDLYYG